MAVLRKIRNEERGFGIICQNPGDNCRTPCDTMLQTPLGGKTLSNNKCFFFFTLPRCLA